MEELISVIVITYNQERIIGRALDAILSQRCDLPMEVIIGEDCSTDGTRKVCEYYARKCPENIRLLTNGQNLGIVENYKNCLRHARGKYLMDCGGDDEWCPGRMQKCLDIMRSHDKVAMIYSDIWIRYDNTGQVRESAKYQHHLTEGIIEGKLMTFYMLDQRYCAPAYSAMARTQCLKEIIDEYPDVFDGSKYGIDDQAIAVLIGKKGDAYYLKERTYYYTSDTSSFIHNPSARKKFDNNLKGIRLIHDLAEVTGIGHNRLKPCYEFRLFALMMHAFREHDKDMRQVAHAYAKELNVMGWRASLVKAVTCNRVTWSMGLMLRKLLV